MTIAVFTATTFLSAFLLFMVQPMFSKMALPLLGGTPAVWNTCMVFFQAVLLAGYAYAHATTTWLGVRRQAVVHLLVLCAPIILLPIAIPHGWVPSGEQAPVIWLLTLLAAAVGLPFFAVSASAPLVQKWFSSTAHPSAGDPYFLYAASNLGSLLALISYPLAIEPTFRLAAQSRLWTAGYALFMLFSAWCVFSMWRSPSRASAHRAEPRRASSEAVRADQPSLQQGLWWALLAAVPSSLMLGVTTHLSIDIAAVPLLWVIPLGLYLLTFIIAFSGVFPRIQHLMVRAMAIVVLPLAILMARNSTRPIWLLVVYHLLFQFIASLVCHGELANRRPKAAHLTVFYLWLSVGGVVGGLFNALVAPRLFTTVIEYPLAIVFACLLRPGNDPDDPYPKRHWMDYALPAALAALVVGLLRFENHPGIPELLRESVLYGLPALMCYAFRYRPIRFGLGIAAFLLSGVLLSVEWHRQLHVERSFFGVYRVSSDPRGMLHELIHGTTLHGAQWRAPGHRREPLTYFTAGSPIGQLFDSLEGRAAQWRVGAIGLGTGSLACYAGPGQEWTFYEIDPTVKRIASTPRYFSFLQDCLERPRIVLGDARLSLQHAPAGAYELIIVDAFSSDAIPIHLITREAVQLYLSKLSEGGLIAFHISNRYLDLEPVLANIAASLELAGLAQEDNALTREQQERGKTPSHWVVIARRQEALGPLGDDQRWRALAGRPSVKVWTDEFSNLLSVFRWR